MSKTSIWRVINKRMAV